MLKFLILITKEFGKCRSDYLKIHTNIELGINYFMTSTWSQKNTLIFGDDNDIIIITIMFNIYVTFYMSKNLILQT